MQDDHSKIAQYLEMAIKQGNDLLNKLHQAMPQMANQQRQYTQKLYAIGNSHLGFGYNLHYFIDNLKQLYTIVSTQNHTNSPTAKSKGYDTQEEAELLMAERLHKWMFNQKEFYKNLQQDPDKNKTQILQQAMHWMEVVAERLTTIMHERHGEKQHPSGKYTYGRIAEKPDPSWYTYHKM